MFVGTWRLVSCEAREPTGVVQYPLGQHATGQIIYDARGNMSAQVMREERPAFASQDSARATDVEVRAAYEGYVAYFGTYTVDPEKHTVTHHVQGALLPNWIGGDQLRYYSFDGERLLLSTPRVESGGQLLEFFLVWERMS